MLEVKSNNPSFRTLDNYLNDLLRFFQHFGYKPIEEYSSVDIGAWKSTNRPRMSDNTLNANLKFYRAFFNICIEKGWTSVNPVKRKSIPRRNKLEPKYIKETEYVRLVFAAEHLKLRDRTVFEILETGVRVSECSGINVEDLDFINRRAFIRGKGGMNYWAHFSQTCAYHLQELIPENSSKDAPVFLNKYNNRLGIKSIYKICIKLGKAIGAAENTHPHRMRHSKATRMIRQGHSLLDVKLALGHRRISTTQRYAYVEKSVIKRNYFKAKEKDL